MNHFGRIFQVNIFGESHGKCVGVLLDGVSSGIKLCEDDFISDMTRRRPQKIGTTKRVESDTVFIESGVFNGYTTGAPILLKINNSEMNSRDYLDLINHPRPSHADFVSKIKYRGFSDYRGGGHFSGRLTAGIVAAGVVAKKISPFSYVSIINSIHGNKNSAEFENEIKKAMNNMDSVGGTIHLTIKDVPVGIGEPFFDSVESILSHLFFSIGGVKGVSFGIGFKGENLYGSEFNDLITDKNGKTITNNNGGINGGISNGNSIEVDLFIKPTPSIAKSQNTFNYLSNSIEPLEITGRHDSAIIQRIPVVVEAMASIGLTDLYLINKMYN